MTQPAQYSPTTDFSQDEANSVSGRSTVRTANIDAEFANIEASINQIVTNIGLLQRDDGAVKDGIVTQTALSNTVLALFVAVGANPRGPWLTTTSYAAKDVIETGSPIVPYMCVTAHTSGTFATDYAAGKWVSLGGSTPTPTASQVTSVATGDVSSTDVQSAIAELASEKMAKADYLSGAIWSMGAPLNFHLVASVGSNAISFSVKGSNGNDPSATNIVYVPFRSSTAGSGDIVWRSLTGALSLTVSSGSTLGHASGANQYIYQYLIDNYGTIEYAVSSKFFGWHGIASTTAEGGAGAADSGTVMYSAVARANVPYICVGMSEDTQITAGAWATAPSLVHLAPFALPNVAFVDGDNTLTGPNTFTQDVTVRSTDTGAGVGPGVILDRSSGSPAAADNIGQIIYRGRDSSANVTDYVATYGQITDPTNGSEDGLYAIQTYVAGTIADRVKIGAGVQVGSPTGGDLGAGRINVSGGVSINNNPLSMVLLDTKTASASATIDFTAFIDSTYDVYEFVLVGLTVSVNDGTFSIRCSTNGGSSWDSSTLYGFDYTSLAGANRSGYTQNHMEVAQHLGNGSNYGYNGTVRAFNLSSSSNYKSFSMSGGYVGWTGAAFTTGAAHGGGIYINATAVNGIRFYPDTGGNFAAGKIYMYGIRKN